MKKHPRSGHGELVLVVEDSDVARRTTEDMLRDIGYETISTDSSKAAIELLRTNPRIAVVFTDINLKGDDSGWILVREAKRLRPEVPSIVTSAVFSECVDLPAGIRQSTDFVPKPHSKERLLVALARAVAKIDPETDSHSRGRRAHV